MNFTLPEAVHKATINELQTLPSACANTYLKEPAHPSAPAGKTNMHMLLSATDDVPRSAWQTLPLLSRLGVNIVYITKHEYEHKVFAFGGERNHVLEWFMVECDPESPSFGRMPIVEGGVLFKFGEGSGLDHLDSDQLDAIMYFIAKRAKAISAVLKKDGLEAAKEEYAKMTPIELKKSFKAYRATIAEKASRGKGSEKLLCPVEISGLLCEACGVEKDGEEGLMRCGRCKKVLYCSSGCQAEDWKAHKSFCG